MVRGFLRYILLSCFVLAGCVGDAEPPSSSATETYNGPNPTKVAELTEQIETENFIFHFRPGDTISVERQEAFHRWAVGYLGITIPKKIDYYKFSFADMDEAVGMSASGTGYPEDYAIATIYPWHAHEAMHLYTYALCNQATIRLFDEGMAIALDFDPYNDDWTPKWKGWPGRGDYVYSEKVREHRAVRRLHRIPGVITSHSFELVLALERGTVNNRVLYDQAGMFVAYLIDAFGIDTMKQAICSVGRDDSLDTIFTKFREVFGVSIQQAEENWWAWLEVN